MCLLGGFLAMRSLPSTMCVRANRGFKRGSMISRSAVVSRFGVLWLSRRCVGLLAAEVSLSFAVVISLADVDRTNQTTSRSSGSWGTHWITVVPCGVGSLPLC